MMPVMTSIPALLVLALQFTHLVEATPSRLEPRRGTKFAALMTDRMKQCEPSTIEFANSGDARPLTVAIMLYDKVPEKLRTDKFLPPVQTTLETIQKLGPLQIFTVKKRDYDPFTFTAVAKRGDKIEVFAFFPNGTGQNMWLDRTIGSGSSSSCLASVCSSTEYLNPKAKKCASCSSLFVNSTSCTAETPKTCSYGVVKDRKCVAKTCSSRQWPGPKGAACIACPDASARSCDAKGKSTSCSVGNVVNGVCKKLTCQDGTYPSSNGRRCLPCADPFAHKCSSANNTTECDWGYALKTNRTASFCVGPYAARFGKSSFMYTTTLKINKTVNATSVVDCAVGANHASVEFPWVWMWSDAGVDGVHCRLVPGGDPGLVRGNPGTGFDVGIVGTCKQNADWPWSPSPASCAEIFLGPVTVTNKTTV
ncbi:BZ3500_MvSof-1268-A1-R1_Chr1-1g01128 [Microbotryum saponariae]|uniref:BZ3500_MvSof-1268-A1-R1_Chr1-1g01128 protein n=1 Tax=Microbotryum saponariae TaxID=289078 RepID=A0A2X0KNB7_9BASI|nr:BZ3500_MvSof-1268-A1-R1_Chr1-1g01128 [Microbotryum saponariae]SCZ93448.1 BZ3501_MvSof-1269-A2-R1_Chr1-1g00725 [Microbotryum saponariae]